jgi:thiol-disulfide isomerase/thioredoxin
LFTDGVILEDSHVKACVWYYCSILAFTLWLVATIVAKVRPYNVQEGPDKLRVVDGILSKISDRVRGNPAPSVTLQVTSASWCGPCQKIKPILEKLKKEGYQIKIINNENPGRPIPALDFYRFGKLDRTETGTRTEEQLRQIFATVEGSIF